jgi:hypothetical protein
VFAVVNGTFGSNATFSLDGNTPNRTVEDPQESQGLPIYSAKFYEIRGLNNSNHTLSIVVNTYRNESGFLAFDYARVNGPSKNNRKRVTPSSALSSLTWS